MSKKHVVEELHKQARRNFPRRRVIIKGFDDLWQADLAEFIPYARENKGHKYILVVIDCYSKFLWTRPLKSKTAKVVVESLKQILKQARGRVPNNLQTDQGKEFYNKEFSLLMSKFNINHYSTYSVKKASIAERVIRTLKNKLYREFSLRGKYKWIDILDNVTKQYNNSKHQTIGMKPVQVTVNTKLNAYDNLKIFGKHRFKVGDVVRVSKFKSVFAKGYTPNWSTELFKIAKIQITNPVVYLLEDMRGQPIAGGFYEQELQKTKHSDVYLVEKVLRKRGDQLYVRWLGFDKSHDQWIHKSEIV